MARRPTTVSGPLVIRRDRPDQSPASAPTPRNTTRQAGCERTRPLAPLSQAPRPVVRTGEQHRESIETCVGARRYGGAPDELGTGGARRRGGRLGGRRRRSAPRSPQSGEPVTVRWFVGLGTGTQPEQIDAQETRRRGVQRQPRRHRAADRDRRQRGRLRHAGHPDRGRRRARHHRPDRHPRLELVRRPVPRPRAARRVDRLRPLGVRRGAGRVLAGGGRRADGAAVRRVPVGDLLQQGPVRRGRPRLPAGGVRRAVRRR